MSLMLKKKGGKVFAPKVPQRRPAPPSSAQSSARPSVERQSQTPAPVTHTFESISIPDQDDGHQFTTEPVSGIVEPTPPQPTLEAPPKESTANTQSTIEINAQNFAVNQQTAAIPPEKDSLKRKTRDKDGSVVVLISASKRRQTTSLKAPRSPPHTAFNKKPQSTDPPSDLFQQPVLPNSPQSTQLESNLPVTAQQKNSIPLATKEAPVVDPSRTETGENIGSPGSPTSDTIPDASDTLPTPENTEDGQTYVYPDPELSATTLGPAGGASGLGAAGDVGSLSAGGAQVAQSPQIVPMAPLNPDGTPGEVIQPPTSGTKKKRITKRKKVQAAEEGDDVRATVEMQLNRPRRAPSKKQKEKKKDGAKKKNARAETPEGAEDEEIDHNAVTMSDLCRDLRIGKKFSKHDEIKQREVQKKTKAKLFKTNPELAGLVGGEQVGEGEGSAQPEGEREEPTPSGVGPQMRIVDGQIVMDDNSMLIDRHARAQAERGEMEEFEENEFTRITTSGTYMKRERAQLWDMAANDLFFKGLRMFGTDFEMIAKMFPHRNRRQIKLKFNKEERTNPLKIDRILKGQGTSIDLDEYEELSGLKFEEVSDIVAEERKIEAEHQAEEQRHEAEIAEATRKKKAAIQAKSGSARGALGAGDDSDQENGPSVDREASAAPKPKKGITKKKGKKSKHTSKGDGGEEFEVLGTID